MLKTNLALTLLVALPALADINGTLTAASRHRLALTGDGQVCSVGSNEEGQLGNGSRTSASTPAPIAGLSNVQKIVTAHRHSIALLKDGTLQGWGDNQWGQLGAVGTADRLSPVTIPGISGVIDVGASPGLTVALKNDGTVWVWGLVGTSFVSQLGLGPRPGGTATPTQVPGLSNIVAIAVGDTHTVVLRADGKMFAWGRNFSGQLGIGGADNNDKVSPVETVPVPGVVAISAGFSFTLALGADGRVWSWGNNNSGQLGNGDTTVVQRFSPGLVIGLTDVVDISASKGAGPGSISGVAAQHSLAVRRDGSVWSWGRNANGQLGDGTTTDRATPVQVPGLSGAVVAAAGGAFSVVRKNDGTFLAWGDNTPGNLGTGNTTSSLTPVTNLPCGLSACSIAQGLTPVTAPANGSKFSVSLSTSPGCGWTASSNRPWMQVFPLAGSGSGNIDVTVFPNFGTLLRAGTLMLAGSPALLTQAGAPGNTDQRFVRMMYFNFFGRLPSDAEVAFNEAALTGGLPRGQLVSNFFNSEEFNNAGRFIAGLYVGILNRNAEYGGWLFIRNALSTGAVAYTQLVANFLDSAEFKLNNPSLTNRQFAALMYRQILLREGAAAELDFMQNVLDTNQITRVQFATNFLQSAEFKLGAGPRLTTFVLHATLFMRDPTPAEFDARVADLSGGATARTVIDNLLADPSFTTLLQ